MPLVASTVDVPVTIDDEDAGGYVEAGRQTLNGDQALILCRSRHTYDEYGSGDYYRMANQRMVMGAIAEKILASDVVTMANTINAMADYITTDMDVQSIVSIATEMHGMDVEEDMYSAMNPTTPAYVDDVWYEYCNLAAWQEMMVASMRVCRLTPMKNATPTQAERSTAKSRACKSWGRMLPPPERVPPNRALRKAPMRTARRVPPDLLGNILWVSSKMVNIMCLKGGFTAAFSM